MKRTASLAYELATLFPGTNGPPGLLGGAYKVLDNAPTRSVHVKIHPRPRSLGESLQILRELKKFGDIDVYRHLKYDFEAPAPNSLLVVYKDRAAAVMALTQNRIAFRYTGTDSDTTQAGKSSNNSTTDNPEFQEDEPSPFNHREPFPRPGELIVRPAKLQHLPYIQRQHYYWPVIAEGCGTPGESMLGKLPPGVQGLRDFDITKREPSLRVREGWSRMWNRKVKERGWETLGQLWNKGVHERANKPASPCENESI